MCSGSRFVTGALDLQRFEDLKKGALDLISACFGQNETSMRIYEYTIENTNRKRDNPRLLYRYFGRIPLLHFENGFISIITHGFSKTHPPQFLNNNYVCIIT